MGTCTELPGGVMEPRLVGALFCDFCGKKSDYVAELIAGPKGIHICNECVDLCVKVIADTRVGKVAASEPPTA